MDKRDCRELKKYVRWVANEIGLRDWTFLVTVGEVTHATRNAPPDDAVWCAKCGPVPGRKYAEITFDSGIRTWPLEDIRHTVTHELTHCHFYGLWDTVRRDTINMLKQKVYDVWISGIERHMEYGVDAMADVIAPQMPLIEWPKKNKSRKKK